MRDNHTTFDFIDFHYPPLMGQVDSGALKSIQLYETDSITGNIYRASIANVIPSLDGAFVDIGLSSHAYLPKKYFRGGRLKEGDTVFVEVKKMPFKDKGAVVTMDYSLQGKYLVYLPLSSGIRLSKKITNQNIKSKLLNWAEKKQIEGSLLFRTHASQASVEELEDELKELYNLQEELKRERNFLPTPKLLLSKSSLENFLLHREPDVPLVVNNRQLYQKYQEKNIANLQYNPNFEFLGDANLRGQFDSLFMNRVYLKEGANIVIDYTEALTVIDVNTAHAKMKESSFSDYGKNINELVAQEIIRQIKLRNISGMVVIDFLRTNNSQEREEIHTMFEDSFRKDSLRTKIFGFSSMGLFEMSRERRDNLFTARYLEKQRNSDLKLSVEFP